jgi:multiple antibiotic resistance protein
MRIALLYSDSVHWTNPAETALNELRTAPWVRFSVLALSSIFFLVDPFAAIGSFLAITESADPVRRKRMARKAAITCFIVLTSFAVAGQLIFRMFGITLPAFEVAGGLILLLIGLDMLQAKRSPTQEASGDTEEASQKEDAGIVPLGIPMLAGPGAISSVMVLVGQVQHFWRWEMGAILGSIGITSLISYWVLAAAGRVRAVMGETGIRILVRIMGLLLVALAMQFFVNGLTDLGIISRQG